MKTSTSKNKSGLLIVLSSPSGGGKTTIAHAVLRKDKNIVRSISCTTRKPRVGEKNGRDYFFITPSKFRSLISQKSFLEWAKVHRNFYGTPRHWVELQLRKGKDVLFVIDVQGGKTIKRKAPGSVLIFVKPPSLQVLKQRLLLRRSEDAKTLKVRQADARWEIQEGRRYDHQVVNDRLRTAIADVNRVISQARKKNRR
jgi:guanylate kinase